MILRARSLKIATIAIALVVLTASLSFAIHLAASPLTESTRCAAISDTLLIPSFVLLFPALHHAPNP